jgi:hypothetical protein
MENAVFWDINTRFISHRRQYVSVTEPSRLKLCKILGVHGGDDKECRLLALLRTKFSGDRITAVIRVKRLSKLGIMLPVIANVYPSSSMFTLTMDMIRSSETSVLKRAT